VVLTGCTHELRYDVHAPADDPPARVEQSARPGVTQRVAPMWQSENSMIDHLAASSASLDMSVAVIHGGRCQRAIDALPGSRVVRCIDGDRPATRPGRRWIGLRLQPAVTVAAVQRPAHLVDE